MYFLLRYYTGAGGTDLVTGVADMPLVGAWHNNENKVAECYDGITDANHAACCGTTTEDGTWAIGVDFGEKKAITRIKVYGPNNFGYHYNWNTDLYIEVSSDGTSWPERIAENLNIGTSSSPSRFMQRALSSD